MKFAFFSPYFGTGGVATTLTRLSEQFASRGHETDLVTFQYDDHFIKESPLELCDLNARRTATSGLGLIRYLRRERPDVMISTHYFANVVAVMAREIALVSPTLILTERLQIGPVLESSGKLKDDISVKLMQVTYPRADHVVTVSKEAADDLADLVEMERDEITAIYNPTLVNRVFEDANEPVDHPWFGTETPVVLAAGRLAPEKDFYTLIKAFSKVTQQTEARLVILGEGDERDQLERLIEEEKLKGKVDLPGFVTNPYKYMRAADLFVLSSKHEGMPNVLVEAAALETPIVATDCPSGPRELLDGGRGGILVPVGDETALSEAIIHQLTNLDEAVQQVTRIQSKLDQFRPAYASEQYLNLIQTSKDTPTQDGVGTELVGPHSHAE